MTPTTRDYRADAMQAAFDLTEAITDGHLSVQDLKEMVEFAVSSGFNTMMICMQMMSHAITLAENNDGNS